MWYIAKFIFCYSAPQRYYIFSIYANFFIDNRIFFVGRNRFVVITAITDTINKNGTRARVPNLYYVTHLLYNALISYPCCCSHSIACGRTANIRSFDLTES